MASVRAVLFCLAILIAIIKADEVDKETQTDLRTFIDLARLNFLDVLRSIALLLVTVVVLMSDKRGETRNWQTFDACCFAIEGLALYLFPEEVLVFLARSKTDNVHTFALQVVGAGLIGFAVATYLQTRNRYPEPRLPFSWLLSRAFGSVMAITVVAHTQLNHYIFNEKAACVIIVSLILVAVGGLYKLFTFHGVYVRRGAGISRVTQTYMILQLMLAAPSAVSQLGMTERIYETYTVLGSDADQVHFFITRAMGILICMKLIQMVYSLQFQNDDDAKTIMASHLVTMILIVPLVAMEQWKPAVYTDSARCYVIPVFITDILVTLAGYHSLDVSLGLCSLFRKESKLD